MDPVVVAQGDHAKDGHADAAVIREEGMAGHQVELPNTAALAVPDESPVVQARPDRPPVVEEDNELEEFTQGGAIQGM